MRQMFIGVLALGALAASNAAPATADMAKVSLYPTVVGQVGITDGDTIRMARATVTAGGQTRQMSNVRIRFFGIDAPEKAQSCLDAKGKSYFCGHDAALAMESMVRSKDVTCEVHDVDRYKRLVAVCSVAGVPDINAELVKRGMAVAYREFSMDYVDEEEAARAAHAGLWAGKFDMPWDWRKAH